MKCIIYCFSGTGNTKLVSKMLANALSVYNIATDISLIDYTAYKKGTYPSPNDYDIVGVSYPIYGFNAPFLVNRFVKHLPRSSKYQKAFIIKTSGEPFKMNHHSSSIIKRYLKHKGYDVRYEKHFLMPYNIMFRYPDSLVKQMYLYAKEYTKVSAKHIKNGDRCLLHGLPLGWIVYVIAKLVWIGGPIIGKTYHINKSRCIKCNLCVNNCPMNNIKLNKKTGFPKFGKHCMICMRCVMYCPHNAINAGILNPWKVNGSYNFDSIVKDNTISSDYVNKITSGYFKLFNKYFDLMDIDLKKDGVTPPRESIPQN